MFRVSDSAFTVQDVGRKVQEIRSGECQILCLRSSTLCRHFNSSSARGGPNTTLNKDEHASLLVPPRILRWGALMEFSCLSNMKVVCNY